MRTLTGITPSGTLHVGNYFGAMKPAIEAQAGGDCYYFIADYHSMTSVTDPAERRAHTRGIAVDWLACGLDPKRSVFWRQSDVPEVCELTWMIGSLTPMGPPRARAQLQGQDLQGNLAQFRVVRVPGPHGGGHPPLRHERGPRGPGPEAAPRR